MDNAVAVRIAEAVEQRKEELFDLPYCRWMRPRGHPVIERLAGHQLDDEPRHARLDDHICNLGDVGMAHLCLDLPLGQEAFADLAVRQEAAFEHLQCVQASE